VTVTIRPTLDTSAYADGDVLFAATPLTDVALDFNSVVMLQSLNVVDISDQNAAFDLLFFSASVTLGTLNAGVSISDADTLLCVGRVQVGSSDYYDLGGADVASIGGIGRMMRTAHQSRDLWVAGVSRGTGTYAANGLQITFGFVR